MRATCRAEAARCCAEPPQAIRVLPEFPKLFAKNQMLPCAPQTSTVPSQIDKLDTDLIDRSVQEQEFNRSDRTGFRRRSSLRLCPSCIVPCSHWPVNLDQALEERPSHLDVLRTC